MSRIPRVPPTLRPPPPGGVDLAALAARAREEAAVKQAAAPLAITLHPSWEVHPAVPVEAIAPANLAFGEAGLLAIPIDLPDPTNRHILIGDEASVRNLCRVILHALDGNVGPDVADAEPPGTADPAG